jgi:hypothetical protein
MGLRYVLKLENAYLYHIKIFNIFRTTITQAAIRGPSLIVVVAIL